MNVQLCGQEKKYSFTGAYGYHVDLTLFPEHVHKAEHVVMLALYQGQLLFTQHKSRGLEWPGGKVEADETPLEAGLRELKEETGGLVSSIWLVGQYKVYREHDYFFKNIYVVQVIDLQPEAISGEDTLGHVLCPVDIKPLPEHRFSPLVCDRVFTYIQQHVLHVFDSNPS